MIIVALGANLPWRLRPPEDTIRAALDDLENRNTEVEAVSRLFRSPAWPDPSDPPFVNAVARISTALSPSDLMGVMHDIEASFGRRRSKDSPTRNAPRTLDLDLIDYDGLVQTGPPVLPHPRINRRAFVLIPLQEVAPGWNHPVSGQTVSELIAALGPEADIPKAL